MEFYHHLAANQVNRNSEDHSDNREEHRATSNQAPPPTCEFPLMHFQVETAILRKYPLIVNNSKPTSVAFFLATVYDAASVALASCFS